MKRWLRANVGFVVFVLCFGFFRTAVADWNPIPSSSMRPNLLEGDVVFVNRLAYDFQLPLTNIIVARLDDPERGDIVTFASPHDGTRLIKRLIAVPGDIVAMRDDELTVNGVPLSYTPQWSGSDNLPNGQPAAAMRLAENDGTHTRTIQWFEGVRAPSSFGPVQIPPDHYLMLGDNRDVSGDSRYFGLVSRELLIGRAERILVSADILDDWSPRFERFGAPLN